MLEVEADREVICRDICRGDQVQTLGIESAELGDDRTYGLNDVVSPGASAHRCGGTASCAEKPEVREQAEAAQHACCDDQYHKPDEQRGGQASNNPPPLGTGRTG